MSSAARTGAATDRQQTRARAESGQRTLDDTVVAIRSTFDDLNTRSQQVLTEIGCGPPGGLPPATQKTEKTERDIRWTGRQPRCRFELEPAMI